MYSANGERKMMGKSSECRKIWQIVLQLLEIVRDIFLSCLQNNRQVYIFQNTIEWKINDEM
jgi:hypothetical protein